MGSPPKENVCVNMSNGTKTSKNICVDMDRSLTELSTKIYLETWIRLPSNFSEVDTTIELYELMGFDGSEIIEQPSSRFCYLRE